MEVSQPSGLSFSFEGCFDTFTDLLSSVFLFIRIAIRASYTIQINGIKANNLWELGQLMACCGIG